MKLTIEFSENELYGLIAGLEVAAGRFREIIYSRQGPVEDVGEFFGVYKKIRWAIYEQQAKEMESCPAE